MSNFGLGFNMTTWIDSVQSNNLYSFWQKILLSHPQDCIKIKLKTKRKFTCMHIKWMKFSQSEKKLVWIWKPIWWCRYFSYRLYQNFQILNVQTIKWTINFYIQKICPNCQQVSHKQFDGFIRTTWLLSWQKATIKQFVGCVKKW